MLCMWRHMVWTTHIEFVSPLFVRPGLILFLSKGFEFYIDAIKFHLGPFGINTHLSRLTKLSVLEVEKNKINALHKQNNTTKIMSESFHSPISRYHSPSHSGTLVMLSLEFSHLWRPFLLDSFPRSPGLLPRGLPASISPRYWPEPQPDCTGSSLAESCWRWWVVWQWSPVNAEHTETASNQHLALSNGYIFVSLNDLLLC